MIHHINPIIVLGDVSIGSLSICSWAFLMVLATMEIESSGNIYEDARKQRLLENKKRFEDLGIMKISKSLSTKSEKLQNRQVRMKPMNDYSMEPRRSSRARNPVNSYRDDVDVQHLPAPRKKSKLHSSWASYLARPVEEVKVASYEERGRAFKCAEKLQSNLQTGNPSFVKSMVRSHVYSCFWLGLPSKFCEDNLPKSTVDMVLENEEGSEYEAVFISKRSGLSGGWRAFALDHKLDDGDALVFELVEPSRFKVYIVRVLECQNEKDGVVELDADEEPNKIMKKRKTGRDQSMNSAGSKTEKPGIGTGMRRSSRNKGN
ncbi:AP2/B3-like transcriptional factor family protein [Perilla frutescens var. hirtella]|uniref:AP2/B3-like transcriptional factor family protein n=1 Tax=Perilla frutescens var. hirtella TaxID=608512 RepID=A0AAD4P6R1_PERFH|nr:AP2/B3-like transcriptional factor family protein [Perilla frutescens var. hirtella]